MITKAAETFQFDAIDDVVSDIAKGRIVIVTDDADRENEGDLVIAAEKVTPEAVNFMATHGRGLICVPISSERRTYCSAIGLRSGSGARAHAVTAAANKSAARKRIARLRLSEL